MSANIHYIQQYQGKKVDFPEQSFLIAGISFYQDNVEGIGYDSLLSMIREPENKYDSTAIRIEWDGKRLGYVPAKEGNYKELCGKYIDEKLRVINIKGAGKNIGVRVIPEKFYNNDMCGIFE